MSNQARNNRLRAFALLLLGPMVLAACASGGSRVSEVCPITDDIQTEYIIGPGDSLEIFVWRHTELTTTIPVRPDGKVSMPLVEDIIAVGRTPTQLARSIEEQLAEYLRTPKVNVIVASQGSSNQIQIVGNVANPQSLPFRQGLRLLDAIVAVGGLDAFAAGNRSKIVRQSDGQVTECRVRIEDLVSNGDVAQNVLLYPGDVVIVPQSRF